MGVWHLGLAGHATCALWGWLIAVATVVAAIVAPGAGWPAVPSGRTAGGPRLWAVRDIRHWATPAYTRVVIDVEAEVSYRSGRLQNPERLYVDLLGTQLDPRLQGWALAVGDPIVKGIRAAQNQPDVVRVVLDLQRLEDYRIFSIDEPYRLVIDIKGHRAGDWPPAAAGPESAAKEALGRPGPGNRVASDGPRERATGRHQRWHVVIDPGHGGKDPGAIGASGLVEKEVVLDIAHRLRALMQQEPYWRVTLTRETDVFLPLEERTAIANAREADLFVSIHANAAERAELHGIETYFLDFATDERAMRTAARENATSVGQVSDLQAILRDLLLTSKRNESSLLAGFVQQALTQPAAGGKNGRDLGVKHAPFLVLIGAEMPAILVETGFISNPAEERKLADPKYRAHLARAILAGLKEYIAATNGSLVRQVSR
jgi:N-acetylmuramoyl-L-alanine amidase